MKKLFFFVICLCGTSKTKYLHILVMWALYPFVPYTNVVENEIQSNTGFNMTILIIKMPRFGEGKKTGRLTAIKLDTLKVAHILIEM